MHISNLQQLFEHEIKDLHSAEMQIINESLSTLAT